MTKRRTGLEKLRRKLGQDPKRSPLFYWIMDLYHDVAPAAAGPRLTWSALREDAIRDGITDDVGQAPSERTVRETWRKVEREIAAKAAMVAAKPAPAKPPSRLPQTLRPLEARPRPAPPNAAPAAPNPSPPDTPGPNTSPVGGAGGENSAQPSAEEQIAAVMRGFRHRDRWMR